MITKILKIIAVAQAIALPNINIKKANASNPSYKGYEILEGQYCSEILLGDISHAYIDWGDYVLGQFTDTTVKNKYLRVVIHIAENHTVRKASVEFGEDKDLIDWERSGLLYPQHGTEYVFEKSYFCLYFKKPLKATKISPSTKQYLSYTSPAREFAGGYDGFVPSFYYTSISGNESYVSGITSTSSLITGKVWTSGDVSDLNIEKNNFIIQNYYVYAALGETYREYEVWLRALAKSKDGEKGVDLNVSKLVYINLNQNRRTVSSYDFPKPVATLDTKSGYYDIIRSGGAYGVTDSVMNYQEGYKDGQGNPTFKSFIVSAFEACSAFFSLPVLGKNITIGTLIGSFVGLGALFLLIKLFR